MKSKVQIFAVVVFRVTGRRFCRTDQLAHTSKPELRVSRTRTFDMGAGGGATAGAPGGVAFKESVKLTVSDDRIPKRHQTVKPMLSKTFHTAEEAPLSAKCSKIVYSLLFLPPTSVESVQVGEQANGFYNADYIHAPNMYQPWQVCLHEQALCCMENFSRHCSPRDIPNLPYRCVRYYKT